MARIARIVIPNYPHHIIQRGNRSQNVFFSDEDKNLFKQHVCTGRSLDDERFLTKLEEITERVLKKKKSGPQKNN